ncbi:glutaredoxin family protein [Oceanospirillum linum]|uniref:Glutaredoxin n=1 Tax=Oceanospirillum linum TaxID=966 RepID=A0A1T1HAA9_OCELI|nr:glutaredoxin family protein [Oceanospirillum linum]OOV86670.1 glutaredoxin [Oceanospirillum linum]SEG26738.1 Glutaredoxin-like domain [Oleiphilus messinensis]SMP27575.1 Glutaredoxin-like domain [Oceanospirillum linum]
MSKVLYLYTTLGCHLCEQAQAIVHPLVAEKGMVLELVEISEQEALVAQYGIRIPVIRLADQEEELGWPFDAEAASRYLSLG